MTYYCPNCGAPVHASARFCPNCGSQLTELLTDENDASGEPVRVKVVTAEEPHVRTAPSFQQPEQYHPERSRYYEADEGINPSWPVRSKIAAGILAIILGDFGIHEFYLGRIGKGVLCLLFCWTGIPGIVGLVQGIIYLTQSDADFMRKNHVRVE